MEAPEELEERVAVLEDVIDGLDLADINTVGFRDNVALFLDYELNGTENEGDYLMDAKQVLKEALALIVKLNEQRYLVVGKHGYDDSSMVLVGTTDPDVSDLQGGDAINLIGECRKLREAIYEPLLAVAP